MNNNIFLDFEESIREIPTNPTSPKLEYDEFYQTHLNFDKNTYEFVPFATDRNRVSSLEDPTTQKQLKTTKLSKDKSSLPIKKEISGCLCSKTKCLRLYCKCFKNSGFCSPECGCTDCFNTESTHHFELRNQILAATKSLDKNAFDRYEEVKGHLKVNSKGCNCKKGCQNQHCSCFKEGIGCSPICKCTTCQNSKINIDKETIGKIYKRRTKKKQKIVFKEPDNYFISKNDFQCFGISYGDQESESDEPELTFDLEDYEKRLEKRKN